MSLLGIFFGGVYETVITGLRTVNMADSREGLRQQMAHAFDLLTREASLANNVDTSTSSQVQFDADLNGDGTTENDILYQVSGTSLQRVYSSGPTLTLVTGLTTLTPFTYLDSSGNATNTAANVRVIEVALTGTRNAETVSLAGAACRRN